MLLEYKESNFLNYFTLQIDYSHLQKIIKYNSLILFLYSTRWQNSSQIQNLQNRFTANPRPIYTRYYNNFQQPLKHNTQSIAETNHRSNKTKPTQTHYNSIFHPPIILIHLHHHTYFLLQTPYNQTRFSILRIKAIHALSFRTNLTTTTCIAFVDSLLLLLHPFHRFLSLGKDEGGGRKEEVATYSSSLWNDNGTVLGGIRMPASHRLSLFPDWVSQAAVHENRS